jgi:CRISPR type I-E-associated protein CasB/Cse2
MADKGIDEFLARLKGYVDRHDRGTLADLRRGFSETTAHRTWPHIFAFWGPRAKGQLPILRLIAAGFATLEGTEQRGNIGATLRRLAMGDRKGKAEQSDALKSFDGRFRRLLTCRTAGEVCDRLPGILRAAKQKGVGVDFRQLYWDLRDWERPTDKRDVRVDWAGAYWSPDAGEGAT